jgi:hypothetical protein
MGQVIKKNSGSTDQEKQWVKPTDQEKQWVSD